MILGSFTGDGSLNYTCRLFITYKLKYKPIVLCEAHQCYLLTSVDLLINLLSIDL